MHQSDRTLLRDLAKRYAAACTREVQQTRRDLWRRHNSLKPTPPLIYVRAFAWREMPESKCLCTDPFFRPYEDFFRRMLFVDTLDDDSIFEPWINVPAARRLPGGLWGLPLNWIASEEPRGAKKMDPPIKDPADAARMVMPHHVIDEEETQRRADRVAAAFGDIVPVNVDRGPVCQVWDADISTRLAQLRGLDQVILDMIDRPDWLHELVAFMRDGILQTHEEAEQAGDWRLGNHQNQAMPYAEELEDPAPGSKPVTREQLWCFCASQEFALVGPQWFEEFILQYQRRIFENFGLLAYGCCEDLTQMIPLLKTIPNLRRIAVSPMANVARCAEQIGADYVLSYRPSPSDMVGYDFDPDRIRRILREDLAACRGCHVDITLKDVETVQHDPKRVRDWVRITREVIAESGPE